MDRWQRWAALALAVVLLVTSVYFGYETRRLRVRVDELRAKLEEQRAMLELLTNPDTLEIPLVSVQFTTQPRPVPQARVLYNFRRGQLFYRGENLPALPPNRAYQLWLIPPQGKPISAGTFTPDVRGLSVVVLPDLPIGIEAKAFAVTVESAGGVSAPTGPKVLVGAVFGSD